MRVIEAPYVIRIIRRVISFLLVCLVWQNRISIKILGFYGIFCFMQYRIAVIVMVYPGFYNRINYRHSFIISNNISIFITPVNIFALF